MTFIVGMGRSGTTMLTNILNLNPKVIACPENEFILFTAHHFKNADFTNEAIVDEFVKLFDYRFSKIISFWKPKPELKNSISSLKNKSFANVCKQVYLHYPFAKNNHENIWIIDKNPIYSLYMDDLNQLFPESKFIVLTRDYRDNILSRKKFSDKQSSLYTLAVSWNYFYDSIFKSIHKNKLDYTLLRYEDLVGHPTESLQKLCTFLNIEFDEQMLHFQDLSKDIKTYIKQNLTDSEFRKLTTMHHNLEKTINKDRVESYIKELTADEIEILDYICSKHAKSFHYNPISQIKPTWLTKIRTWMSYCKLKTYYYLHSIGYKIPLRIKLLLADKK